MQPCELSITTSVDGQENTILRKGEMECSASSVVVRYKEENAYVCMRLTGEMAEIERQGDYTLRLRLKRGECTAGEIGIGGAGGAIQTFTHQIAYSTTSHSLLLSLKYDLIISGEIQQMKLRIFGKVHL